MESATITAGGKKLSFSGLHAVYLQTVDGMDADSGLLAAAIADLPADSVLLDVGANIGVTALAMAVQRPDCRLIAFEAVPSNADCLRRNIQSNGITNVEVIEAAVSDSPGTTAIADNGPWSVISRDGPVKCRAVTLDEYATPEVHFVKIDVEGYEPNVLAGAPRLLDVGRPLLAMEFNTWALLLHHYDPLVFAESLWAGCEVLGLYHADATCAVPDSGLAFLHMNLTQHGCWSDLLLRARGAMPGLAAMTDAPEVQHLRAELGAVRASTSWRITAPLRAATDRLRQVTP